MGRRSCSRTKPAGRREFIPSFQIPQSTLNDPWYCVSYTSKMDPVHTAQALPGMITAIVTMHLPHRFSPASLILAGGQRKSGTSRHRGRHGPSQSSMWTHLARARVEPADIAIKFSIFFFDSISWHMFPKFSSSFRVVYIEIWMMGLCDV